MLLTRISIWYLRRYYPLTGDHRAKGCPSKNDRPRRYSPPSLGTSNAVTVILLLVSASLAARPGEEENVVEVADPTDPTRTIRVEEKYPGEAQW
jgi:hypothetical protein